MSSIEDVKMEDATKKPEEVEDDVLASCLSSLRSDPTVRLHDEPRGSSLFRPKGAGRDWELDVVGRGSVRVD